MLITAAMAIGDTQQAIGRLAAGIAHDFNNLLTSIIGFSHLLRERLPEGSPEREYAAQIATSGDRAAGLVRQMLAFSADRTPNLSRGSLHTLLEGLRADLPFRLGTSIALRLECDAAEHELEIDEEKWRDLVQRLAQNAADAMPRGGTFTIRTSNPAPGWIEAEFRDDGEGMTPATVARMFEPFFSTRETHERPGLGLSIVYAAIEQHGGQIRVRSAPGQGCAVFIRLPLSRVPAAAPPAPSSLSRRILVVDDEVAVRKIFQHQLQALGYEVDIARDGDEALRMVERGNRPLDLLLTDISMPGLRVDSLVEEVRRRQPGCQILYTSGYPQGSLPADQQVPAAANFLQKPCTREVLASVVRQVLEAPARAALNPRVV